MTTAGAVHAGSTWRSKQTNVDALVIRLTDGGQVILKRRDGKTWTIPLIGFITNWEPTSAGHVCAKCGTATLRLTDKYCRDCLSLIMRVRNARQHNQPEEDSEPVLTTTSPKIVEQRHQEHVSEPVRESHADDHPSHKWRITGHIVMEVTVDGDTPIDALAAADALYQGIEVTDFHRLD